MLKTPAKLYDIDFRRNSKVRWAMPTLQGFAIV